MSTQSKLKQYYKNLQEIQLLEGIYNLLDWDQQNSMPHRSTSARSEKIALVSKLQHERLIDKDYAKILNDLYEKRNELDPVDKRSIEFSKKNYDKKAKLPTDFVEKMSKTSSQAHNSWVEAKTKEDFSIFKKDLQKIVDLTKKYAEYIDKNKPVYDVLSDDYEEEMTGKELDDVFNYLVMELPPLLKKIKKRENKKTLSGRKFDKDKTKRFLKDLTEKIGFDFQRGTMGEVPHPFETTITAHDVRINMKYPEEDIQYSIMSGLHELGHGLYEQNIDEKYHGTHLKQGVSLGIHESQSRLLENMIGRSESFWKFALPLLESHLPEEMSDIDLEDIVNDVNLIQSSFIRTEADMVTYNIHILLRYQLENDLLNSKLTVDDLPEAWNSKMQELLGIVPEKPSLGVLQDVHWSMGALGYFPTYTLGNLNAAQLWNSFKQDHPDWEVKIEVGDFSEYFNWFKDKIWQHGSFYKPKEIMLNVTGEKTNPKYYVEYLKENYL